MITRILDLLFDIIIFFLTLASKIISFLSKRDSLPIESESTRLHRLQRERSELVIQRETLPLQITNIESSIQNIQKEIIDNRNTDRTPPRDTPDQRDLATASSRPLHPINRFRPRGRRSTVVRPYPIPYTPPRTPDEERRNRVVEWLNELRLRQHDRNGNPG